MKKIVIISILILSVFSVKSQQNPLFKDDPKFKFLSDFDMSLLYGKWELVYQEYSSITDEEAILNKFTTGEIIK